MSERAVQRTLVALSAALLDAAAALGAPCVALSQNGSTAAEPVELRLAPSVPVETARAALSRWDVCRTPESELPVFTLEPGPRRVLSVRREPSGGRDVCGELRGREIVLYAFAFLPGGRVVRCEPVEKTLAHELGHVLGLLDSPLHAGCHDHIMARLRTLGDSREVHPAECSAVAARWHAPARRVDAALESSW